MEFLIGTLGDLAPGQTVHVTIEVLVALDPELAMFNTTSATSLTDDPVLGNNNDLTVTTSLEQLVAADGFEFCGSVP